YRERGWKKLILEKPEVWGAQGLSGREVTMRLVAKTAPMRQLEVARELRARVKATLDDAGVQPAGPDPLVTSAPPPPAPPGAPAPAANGLAEAEAGEPPMAEDVLVAAREAPDEAAPPAPAP